MKKKIGLFIFVLLCSMPVITHATDIFTCNSDSYHVEKIGTQVLDDGYYTMRFYDTKSNGAIIGNTFCMSPGKKVPQGVYKCSRKINPTDSNSRGKNTQAYDMAITKAYQLMLENGYLTSSAQNRIIGELVFRWLSFNYGQGDSISSYSSGPTEVAKFTMRADGLPNAKWQRSGDGYEQAALILFKQAKAVGDQILAGKTYDEVVDNESNNVWSDHWDFNVASRALNTQNNIETITIKITPKAGTGVLPEKVLWEDFTATCSNGYKCTYTTTANQMIVNVDRSTGSGDYGLTINTAYYDKRSAMANIMLLYSTQSDRTYQRMLVISPGEPTLTDTSTPSRSPHGGTPHKIVLDSCTCDTNTGLFTYTKTENGSQTTTTCDPNNSSDKCQSFVNTNSCSPTTCSRTPHSCEVNSSSPKGYYCKESSLGKGDGQACDKEQYESDCCDEICNKDPNSDSCKSCKKKTVCVPTVSLPSSCNNFGESGVSIYGNRIGDTTQNTVIDDINGTTSNNCASTAKAEDKDLIKTCVINSEDLAGNSFQLTSDTQVASNNYCKVWCKEKYTIGLPTAQRSTSGGYFKLETTASGERDCYTSAADDTTKPIDEAKFLAKVKEEQAAIINAWNEYNHWKVGSEQSDRTRTISDSNNDCTDPTEDGCDDYCNASDSWTQYYYSWSYKIYNSNGVELSATQAELTSGDGSCYNCGCSGNNGHSMLSEFKSKADSAKTILLSAIQDLQKTIQEYNSCFDDITNSAISNISGVSNAVSSTGWKNDFDFEPLIKYNYNQDYISHMSGKFDDPSGKIDSTSNNTYCTGDTDDHYNCLAGATGSGANKAVSVLSCNEDNCNTIQVTVGASKWIKKAEIVGNTTYTTKNNFSTYTPYGTIGVNKSGEDALWTTLPQSSFPVSLVTKSGVFPFKITLENIGQSNANGNLGRLIGDSNSVLNAYNNPNNASRLDKANKCQFANSNIKAMTQDVGYVCHYLNNCDTCDFTCDDKNNCQFDDNHCDDNGTCYLDCKNCAFDGNTSAYSYRTVSLNKLFPNGYADENSSANWGNNESNSKGKATKEEIEKNSDSIYETPEYSYTLTPTNLKNIRDYNDRAGSYTNSKMPDNNDESLYCDTVTDPSDGEIKYPVRCRSRFLDLIAKSSTYVQNTNNQIIRNTDDDNFILWSDISKADGIGPAWK